jgi:tungstate transport system ATP-binding protein
VSVLPLEIEALRYEAGGRRLLDDVSLRLEAGPLTIVLGPNGAGKSLLLRLAHGLLEPSAGRVRWAGRAPAEARRRTVMVFQHSVLLRRSAAANVDFALRVRRVPRAERAGRVARALERVGLADRATRPAQRLSAGERQRLALARAWALQPEALLLDEPTASLDPASTRAIEEALREIHAGGTKVVMTTHDLGQARRLAGEIVFLHRGALVEHSPAPGFFSSPRTDEARVFLKGELLC